MHVVPLLSFFRVDERERRCICDIGTGIGAVDGWRPRLRPRRLRPIDMVFFDRRPRPSVLEAKINNVDRRPPSGVRGSRWGLALSLSLSLCSVRSGLKAMYCMSPHLHGAVG